MASAYSWSAVAFVLAAVALVVFMLAVPRLLGGRSGGTQKQEVFESGVVGAGNARMRLSAKFYLVAIFFVIFDLEALYLYAYAVSVREVSWLGFAAAAVFIGILFIGLVYELSLGAMNWSPNDKRRSRPRYTEAPSGFNLASITKFNGIDELQTDPTGKVPAQSSGQINVSNDIESNRRHLQNIDHINTTGVITSYDFNERIDDKDAFKQSDVLASKKTMADVDTMTSDIDVLNTNQSVKTLGESDLNKSDKVT